MQASGGLRAALIALLLLPAVLPGSAAYAQAPRPWEMGMQPAFSPMKQQIIDLHDLVLVIITIITLFVGALLVWVCFATTRSATRCPARPAITPAWKSPGP